MPSLRPATVASALAALWTIGTAVFLLVLSSLILLQPRFPLNFGEIRTTGLPGLWVTFLPAVAAVGGLLLLRRSPRSGATLLATYSLFWTSVLSSGFPEIWNARRSFCLNALNFCIISPWVARVTLGGLVLPFLLCGTFYVRGRMRKSATA